MKGINKYLIVFIIFILLFFQSIYINAENNKDSLSILLIIDTSGSMKTTDPQGLRKTAADVFIDLLDNEDYLGIITFSSYVNLVIPLEQLKDSSIRDSYKESLGTHLEAKGDTDYTAAFMKASEELSKLEAPNTRKVIVFLTDGKPTPGISESLWDVVSDLSSKNYPVYSIGFSNEVDVEILDRIAEETKGDVRIFEDVQDLDKNLIQLLKTREIIASQLLVPKKEIDLNSVLSISTDFWMKREGFRIGEETIVAASLNLGNVRMQSEIDLIVEEFNLNINYNDGTEITIPLLDDGETSHGDIKANDGIWSNKLAFDKNGKAKATITVSGKYRNEPFLVKKVIGEYLVDNPGNVFLNSYDKNLWTKKKKSLIVPLTFNNESSFKEVIFIDIDEKIGDSNIKQVELEANSKIDLGLKIDLNPNLKNGIYDLTIGFRPLSKFTIIGYKELKYKIEILSSFEFLSRTIKDRYGSIVIFIGITICVLLLIYIFGNLLYILIVRPQTKVKGALIYEEKFSTGESKIIDLSNKKKKQILITFDSSKKGDFYIEGSEFIYDIEISREFVNKRRKFLLGWKALLARNVEIIQVLRCTRPGIIIYEDEIYTSIILNQDKEFSSGGFDFQFTISKPKWIKESTGGKNILEGRV